MAKRAKSKNTKINSKQIKEENEMTKFIKLIIIVTIIFGLFYALTVFINKKEAESTDNDTQAEIQYDEILIGNIFDQPNKNYYVLIKNSDDKNVQVYEAYLSTYSQKEDSKRVYTANLNNMFNSKYMYEEDNFVNAIVEFRVSGTTLLEIANGKIENYYDSAEEIRDILKEISKTEEN